jgi:hypothetical protein
VDLVFFDPPYALVQERAGWERVRVQVSRAAGLMKEKSFAVVRTPWPFRHLVAEEGAAEDGAAGTARARGPARRGRRGDEEEERVWEGEELRELEESGYAEAIEGFDEDDEVEEMEAAAPAGRWEGADLRIAGMRGPETHVYGSTAIHLYEKE